MKNNPTWKSTAFLLMMANIIGTLFAAVQQHIPPQTAAIISACLTAIFTGFNAWIKVNAPVDPIVPVEQPK